MRLSGFLTIASIQLALLLGPGLVHAQDVDVEHFRAATGAHDLLGVYSSKPLGHFEFHTGLTTHLANDELTWTREGAANRPVADRWRAELTIAAGFFDLLEIGLSMPVNLWQTAESIPAGGPASSATGLGDLRAGVKAQLLDNATTGGFGLAAIIEASFPTDTGNQLMNDDSPGFSPVLIADFRHGSGLVAAINLGYRYRSISGLAGQDLDHALVLNLGGEVPLGFYDLSFVGELLTTIGTRAAEEGGSDEWTKPAELLGAFRWRREGFSLTAGAGAGLTDGFGAPDWRVLLAFGFRFPSATEPARTEIASDPPPEQTHQESPVKQTASEAERPEPGSVPAVSDELAETQATETEAKAKPVPFPVAEKKTPPTRPAVTEPAAPTKAPDPASSEKAEIPDDVFDRAAESDPDPDGDGLASDADRCPAEREDLDGFEDGDGCPDPDNDHDGVPDGEDRCPQKAEVINGIEDEDGCPDEGQATVAVTGDHIEIRERVFFEPGSDKLDKRSRPILDQLAQLMKAAWTVRLVRIVGHTDDRGDPEMNVYLSERRARRVRAYLIQNGIGPRRLDAKGLGPTQPVETNDTRVGRAKNRRVEFKVLKVVAPKEVQP